MRHTNPFTSRKWKRDLTQVFIQAAVVDLLTAGDFSPEIDDRGVAEYIRTAFSNFVSGQTLNQLNTTAPKHEAEFYLRIWWALDSNRTGSLGHLLQTDMDQLLKPARESPAIETTIQVHALHKAWVEQIASLGCAFASHTSHRRLGAGLPQTCQVLRC